MSTAVRASRMLALSRSREEAYVRGEWTLRLMEDLHALQKERVAGNNAQRQGTTSKENRHAPIDSDQLFRSDRQPRLRRVVARYRRASVVAAAFPRNPPRHPGSPLLCFP